MLRRGNPTLNASWSPGTTVLAGDYFFARAAALAAEASHVRVMTIFANTLMAICSGELRQIFDRRDVPSIDGKQAWKAALGRYDQRIEAKTASLFAAATEAAAVLSGAPEPEIAALRDYGRLLGMGFQIVDDVLDFQGDPTELGKPVAGDLREGIVTLPALYYLRDHPEDSRVAMVVRGTDANERLVGDVVAAIQESGAISQALDRAGDVCDAQPGGAWPPCPTARRGTRCTRWRSTVCHGAGSVATMTEATQVATTSRVDLTVVIVSWNVCDLLRRCLSSVLEICGGSEHRQSLNPPSQQNRSDRGGQWQQRRKRGDGARRVSAGATDRQRREPGVHGSQQPGAGRRARAAT